MLPKITSLFDLFNKAKTNKFYEQLVIKTAKNFGGDIVTFEDAKKYLSRIAKNDGDCSGVVREANFCREFIDNKVYYKKSVIKYEDIVDREIYIDPTVRIDRLQQMAQEICTTIITAQQSSTVFIDEQIDFIPIVRPT